MAKGNDKAAGGNANPAGDGETLPEGTLPAVKRGRGRPPGSKTKLEGKADTPRNPPNAEGVEFVVEIAASSLELADSALEAVLIRRAKQVLPAEAVEEILKARRAASLSDGEMVLVKKSMAQIAAKYDFATKYGPEIFLGVMLLQYGVRQSRVFATLGRIEKAQAELKQRQSKQGAPDAAKPEPAKVPDPTPGPQPSTPPAP